MVKALIDTSIFVDISRDYPQALSWYANQSDLGISRALWMEVIEGVENRRKQQDAINLLERFELIELSTNDLVWASQQLLAFRLSHNIDPFDCMIASVNHRLQVPLYTRNMKHFRPLLGALAESPY